MLARRIAAHQHPLTCLPELRRALLDEWCNSPQDQIDNLILSMPRRLSHPLAAFPHLNSTHNLNDRKKQKDDFATFRRIIYPN
ncbi:hypothetical protein TNCV_2318061 [Trichonephila clavipes]|nr:hypothetical protein TNCV_2318061 [Trichonephila clavipes]